MRWKWVKNELQHIVPGIIAVVSDWYLSLCLLPYAFAIALAINVISSAIRILPPTQPHLVLTTYDVMFPFTRSFICLATHLHSIIHSVIPSTNQSSIHWVQLRGNDFSAYWKCSHLTAQRGGTRAAVCVGLRLLSYKW